MTDSKQQLVPPKFVEGMSYPDFISQIDSYEAKMRKERYDILLDLVNQLLKYTKDDTKLKTLLSFKCVKEKRLLKDPKHNRDVIRKNINNIKKVYGAKFSVEDDTDSDDIEDRYIIYVLTKLLANIGYTMKSEKVGETIYYTIKFK